MEDEDINIVSGSTVQTKRMPKSINEFYSDPDKFKDYVITDADCKCGGFIINTELLQNAIQQSDDLNVIHKLTLDANSIDDFVLVKSEQEKMKKAGNALMHDIRTHLAKNNITYSQR